MESDRDIDELSLIISLGQIGKQFSTKSGPTLVRYVLLGTGKEKSGTMGSLHALMTKKQGRWSDGKSRSCSQACLQLAAELSSGIEWRTWEIPAQSEAGHLILRPHPGTYV